MRALVIADDLTGAAEVAAIGQQFGLQARLWRGLVEQHVADDPFTVLDTDTRCATPDVAARRVAIALSTLTPGAFDLVYKKTDSVLRGPVAAELHTVADWLAARRTLLVPQNPSRGRTVDDAGTYSIDGVPLAHTAFASDPACPITSSRVADLLAAPAMMLPVSAAARDWNGIALGCGERAEHLAVWAASISSDDGAETLRAGGADFLRQILSARLGVLPALTVPLPGLGRRVLVVTGSAAPRLVSEDSARSAAVHVQPMPDAVYENVGDVQAAARWAENVARAIEANGIVHVVVPQAVRPAAADHVERQLAALTASVLHRVTVDDLLVTGGSTAAAVCTRLSWTQLEVLGEFGPGAVALRPAGATVRFTVKPGSYRWPDIGSATNRS